MALVKEMKSATIYTIVLLILMAAFLTVNQFGLSEMFPVFVAVCWTVIIVAYVILITFHSIKESTYQCVVIASFFLKMLLLVIDIFSNHVVETLLNGTDAPTFREMSLMYYEHNTLPRNLYSYVLAFQYNIFGSSYFVTILINITLFTLGTVYIIRTIKLSGSRSFLLWVVVSSFAPYVLLHSVLLLREAIYFFASAASFHFFALYILKQRRMKYFIYAILLTGPMILLHQGNIAITLAYLMGYFNASTKKLVLRISLKKFLFDFAIVAFSVIALRYVSTNGYLSLSERRLFGSITGTYRSRFLQEGGSRYLNWMPVPSNWIQLVLFTPLRMLYFLFAPLPTNWRNWKDIVSFLMDSSIYLCGFYYLCSALHSKRSDRKLRILVQVGAYMMFNVALIFGWGTATAGAAIRHRLALIPMICSVSAIAKNKSASKWFGIERMNYEPRCK